MKKKTSLSTTDIAKATRNEGYGTFLLENPHANDGKGDSREFELKHLDYDSYLEFCDLARPILQTVAGGLDLGGLASGDLQFNPAKIDFGEILRQAGSELPRMVWLCCKQTDPKITLEEVKRLGYRPQAMLTVVLKQIKHNEMVQEFASFFPKIVEQFTALLPDMEQAVKPTTIQPAA